MYYTLYSHIRYSVNQIYNPVEYIFILFYSLLKPVNIII